jgi:hypothetical protein
MLYASLCTVCKDYIKVCFGSTLCSQHQVSYKVNCRVGTMDTAEWSGRLVVSCMCTDCNIKETDWVSLRQSHIITQTVMVQLLNKETVHSS